jgi:peptidoglycan/LPS O-acetylase OafA/YrhL
MGSQPECSNFRFPRAATQPWLTGSRGIFCRQRLLYPLCFQQQGKKYSDFFIRRFFRIYPAYLVAVLLFAFLFPKTALNFSGASASESWRQLLSHLLLIHNFWAGTFSGINASFWSLAIEVQLYLLYPVLLFLITRLGWKWTLIFLGIVESIIHLGKEIVLFSTISTTHFLDHYPPGISAALTCLHGLGRSPFAYWFSWSLGALIAEYYLQKKPQPLANVSPMIWFGCIVICFVFRPLAEFMFAMGCVFTATLLSRLLQQGIKVTPSRFGWKFLSLIGTLSYSLYLLHQPIIFALPTGWLGSYGTLAKLALLGFVGLAVLLLSWLSYTAIEAPSIKMGKALIKLLKSQTPHEVLN